MCFRFLALYPALVLAASVSASITDVQAAPANKPAAATPAESGAQPKATSASYGDWTVNCQQVRDGGAGNRRACEVMQSLQTAGASGPIAQVAFGRPKPDASLSITILLPTNVALDQPVRVSPEAKDGAVLDLTWRKCLPVGCFSESPLAPNVLKQWRAGKGKGRIELRNAAGQDVVLPLSLAGLSDALDALPND